MSRIPRFTRRSVMAGGSATAASLVLARPALGQRSGGRVVVVGAGFGGAAFARSLRRAAPGVAITVVEPEPAIVTCPFSNGVLAGLQDMGSITFGLDRLRAEGIEVVRDRVSGLDGERRTARLAGGADLAWDRLVLSPGIDFKWDAIAGYGQDAAEEMPHAWKAGPQTALLRRQLEAMDDGGTVVICVPANPYRCPPGPYERASLIAWYLKTRKPRSKLLLVDAKDTFSKQGLFLEAWKRFYPGLLEWVPFAQAGALQQVDPGARTIKTDFMDVKASVANIIPPQRASRLVDTLGLAAGGDWCRIDGTTFESVVVPGVHVLGDAAIAGAMPKSAFAATSQAKICALAVAALLAGREPPRAAYLNTCYSLVAPDYGITVGDVFRVDPKGAIVAVEGAGGVSPLGAPDAFRAREADYARGWYASITAETFG